MDISTMIPHLSERRADALSDAVERLEAAIAVKTVRNSDFVQWKETINRAVDESFESLNDSIGNWHYDTLVMGAWNIPAALSEASRCGIAARVELLTAMLPLRELLQAAKPLIVKRERKEAPVEAQPPAGYMTCQVCGRAIGAATGFIALHGYRRPGNATQTKSCDGAGFSPYEVSRDRLHDLIAALRDRELKGLQAIEDVMAERAPVVLSLPDRSQPLNAYGYRPRKTFVLTRADAREMIAELPSDGGIPIRNFDDAKSRDIASRRSGIGGIRTAIATLQKRHDDWVVTHSWDTDLVAWKPLTGRKNP